MTKTITDTNCDFDNTLSSVNWDKVSSWEPSHIDETFLSTINDMTDAENAMFSQKNQSNGKITGFTKVLTIIIKKLVFSKWVYCFKIVNGNKKTKAKLAAKGYQEESNIKSDFSTCNKESLSFSQHDTCHAIDDTIH